MANVTNKRSSLEELDEDQILERLEEDDFIFIVSKDGLLKTVVCPEDSEFDLSNLTDGMKSTIAHFGINLHQSHTIH